jgi:hypothetical protein
MSMDANSVKDWPSGLTPCTVFSLNSTLLPSTEVWTMVGTTTPRTIPTVSPRKQKVVVRPTPHRLRRDQGWGDDGGSMEVAVVGEGGVRRGFLEPGMEEA